MYNGIYFPYLKSKEKKKSRGSKELFTMETIVDNKLHSVEEATRAASKPHKPIFSGGSSKFDDEVSIGVDWEGELIITLDELNKSRK